MLTVIRLPILHGKKQNNTTLKTTGREKHAGCINNYATVTRLAYKENATLHQEKQKLPFRHVRTQKVGKGKDILFRLMLPLPPFGRHRAFA